MSALLEDYLCSADDFLQCDIERKGACVYTLQPRILRVFLAHLLQVAEKRKRWYHF